MDLSTAQIAVLGRLPSLKKRLWLVYGTALAFLALLTALTVVHLRHQAHLLKEISVVESPRLAALYGQTTSMAFAILLLGIVAVIGLTLLVILSMRSMAHFSSDKTDEELLRRKTSSEDSSRWLDENSWRWDEEMSFREEKDNAGARKVSEAAWTLERIELLRRVREQATELVAAHEQIARSTRAKDEFIASMSHELRTPLHAVLGLSEALRDEVHGPISDQQRSFLRNIENSGRHLLGLINNVLDIARVGTDKLRFDLASVSVPDLCHSSIAVVSELAERKNLSLVCSIDAQVKEIQADERRFRQILVNLLANAVKFTPKGGSAGLKVQGDAAGGVVRFTVWDTGIGIDSEDIQRLFRPFVQVDGRRSRRYEGSGLGLSLAYHLADLHRGGIHVESIPEEGSEFVVSLPWRSSEAEEFEAANAQALTGAPLILVLAHNKIHTDGLAAAVEKLGARVVVAEDSRRALALMKKALPSLILLKNRLSGLQDLEFVETVRDDPRLRDLPIVALTALSVSGERERCLASGVDDFLPLPLRTGELLEAVQNQLARKFRRQKLVFAPPIPEQTGESPLKAAYASSVS